MTFRLPTHGWLVTFFATGDDVSFIGRKQDELLVLAAAQAVKSLSDDWKFGLGCNYAYQDQVVDVSTMETNSLTVARLQGHSLSGRTFLKREWGNYWAEGELNVARQWLLAPLDSFLQAGAKVSVGRKVAPNSSLSLSFQWAEVAYDTREEVTLSLAPLPGTHLRSSPKILEAGFHATLDAEKHWVNSLTLGYELNNDNGEGYFDYRALRAGDQLKWTSGRWEASVYGRLARYDFYHQTVSDTDLRGRARTVVEAGVRLGRNFSRRIKGTLSYSYDRSLAVASYDRYEANILSAGVEVGF